MLWWMTNSGFHLLKHIIQLEMDKHIIQLEMDVSRVYLHAVASCEIYSWWINENFQNKCIINHDVINKINWIDEATESLLFFFTDKNM